MASAPSEPRPILGRIDKSGRLIAADPELEQLQCQAGAKLGERLVLPQVAAVAQLARSLGIPVARSAIAASDAHDIDLWVEATPDGDEVALALTGWTQRPPAPPRLAALLGSSAETDAADHRNEWAADEELRLISLAPGIAEHLGVEANEVAGQPLTRALRLVENADGDMPLISALAARRAFAGQRASSRGDDSRSIILDGDLVTAPDGRFAGFRGTAKIDSAADSGDGDAGKTPMDDVLEDVLRSPIDRIIESAEHILGRSDGPLRSDYASYGNDIAAAARHLLSVVRSMNQGQDPGDQEIDLSALAAEAVVMLESLAEERDVRIAPETTGSLPAKGQAPAVIQILVNLIGNALRHSPQGGSVRVAFGHGPAGASVTVADDGPGIEVVDQQRIFERFERVEPTQGGTGLGLAISRRLARSMGGDVTLESASGQGARFTLTLPSA